MAPNNNLHEFEALFYEQYALLFGRAWRLLPDKQTAGLIVRTAFQDVFNNWVAFANKDQLTSYLHATTVKHALDSLKDQKGQGVSQLSALVKGKALAVPEQKPALGTLSGYIRATFVLSRFEKFSHQTIALQLSKSNTEVRSLMASAVTQLAIGLVAKAGLPAIAAGDLIQTALKRIIAGVGTPKDHTDLGTWVGVDVGRQALASLLANLEVHCTKDHGLLDVDAEWAIVRGDAAWNGSEKRQIKNLYVVMALAAIGLGAYYVYQRYGR